MILTQLPRSLSIVLCLSLTATVNASPLNNVETDSSTPPIHTAAPATQWKSLDLQRGETLSTLFERHELCVSDLYAMLKLDAVKSVFRKLRPGQSIRVRTDADNNIQALHLVLNPLEELHIARDAENQFIAERYQRPVETREVRISGNITSSLFEDGKKAGLTDRQVMEMLDIFRWDIDFALDLQEGDQFQVVFEEYWYRGEKVKTGSVKAAEFINNEHSFRAVRYTDPEGDSSYYTPEGNSLRKAFIRTPVKMGRVTSGFTLSRYHPVLHRFRAHRGVDYGAPTGTPIYATGKGKVQFRGRKGGYGNAIILSHAGNYTTLYGHLSKFAKNLKAGQRVKQGDLIGYVGSTGLASGPHLHYEFRVNGVHKNPLTVKLPNSEPIPAEYRQDFLLQSADLVAKLDSVQVARLAAETAVTKENVQ